MKLIYKVEFYVEVDNVKSKDQSLNDVLHDDKTVVRILDSNIEKVGSGEEKKNANSKNDKD